MCQHTFNLFKFFNNGILHDVLEDTQITAETLANDGIPEEVLAALQLLTREDGIDYFEYILEKYKKSLKILGEDIAL